MKNPVLAVVAVLALLLAGGCAPDEIESPTPTPSPSPSPTTVSASPTPSPVPSPSPEPSPEPTFTQELSPEQQEAYDRTFEYFTLHNELMKDPQSDWQPLINTTTGETLRSVLDEFQTARSMGFKRVGDQIFYITEVLEPTEVNGDPHVEVHACTDSAESDIIDIETEESVMEVDGPLVLQRQLTLVREGGGNWQVATQRSQMSESCP